MQWRQPPLFDPEGRLQTRPIFGARSAGSTCEPVSELPSPKRKPAASAVLHHASKSLRVMPGTISLVTYDASGKPHTFRGLRKEDVLSCAMEPEANGAPDQGWDYAILNFDDIAAEQARSRATMQQMERDAQQAGGQSMPLALHCVGYEVVLVGSRGAEGQEVVVEAGSQADGSGGGGSGTSRFRRRSGTRKTYRLAKFFVNVSVGNESITVRRRMRRLYEFDALLRKHTFLHLPHSSQQAGSGRAPAARAHDSCQGSGGSASSFSELTSGARTAAPAQAAQLPDWPPLPKKEWRRHFDDEHLGRRVAAINSYFAALLRDCVQASSLASSALLMGFLAEPGPPRPSGLAWRGGQGGGRCPAPPPSVAAAFAALSSSASTAAAVAPPTLPSAAANPASCPATEALAHLIAVAAFEAQQSETTAFADTTAGEVAAEGSAGECGAHRAAASEQLPALGAALYRSGTAEIVPEQCLALPVPIAQPGQVLIWGFATRPHDISFGVKFTSAGASAGAKATEVEELRFRPSHQNTILGLFDSGASAGTAALCFDNSASQLKRLKLWWRVAVVDPASPLGGLLPMPPKPSFSTGSDYSLEATAAGAQQEGRGRSTSPIPIYALSDGDGADELFEEESVASSSFDSTSADGLSLFIGSFQRDDAKAPAMRSLLGGLGAGSDRGKSSSSSSSES